MCRQALVFSEKNIAPLMPILFEEWQFMQPDGFGYWLETKNEKEYMQKSTQNRDFNIPKDAKSFLLHCRTATSGKENVNSQHPFMSENKNLILTHNGILYGYKKLRKKLLKNHQFKSAVDSEILLHLFEDIYKEHNNKISQKMVENYVKAIIVNKISGSINVLVVDRTNKDWMVLSGGQIEVCHFMNNKYKIDYKTLMFASDIDAFDWIKDKTVFSYKLPTNTVMIGNRNILKETFKVKPINSWNYFKNANKYRSYWQRWY